MEQSEKIIDANIYNFNAWVTETDPKVLYEGFDAVLKEVGYTVLNYIDHHFPVKGYTCLWLLAESHLAIHTFPEEQKSYIELSGCNQKMNHDFERIVHERYSVKK